MRSYLLDFPGKAALHVNDALLGQLHVIGLVITGLDGKQPLTAQPPADVGDVILIPRGQKVFPDAGPIPEIRRPADRDAVGTSVQIFPIKDADQGIAFPAQFDGHKITPFRGHDSTENQGGQHEQGSISDKDAH